MSPDRHGPRSSGEESSPSGRVLAILGAGFSLATSALAGLALGAWLDRNRQGHLFAALGCLLGLLAGFHRAYLLVRNIAASDRKMNSPNPGRTPERKDRVGGTRDENEGRDRKLR